jgi:ABC-type nitrate/sulfonate/bicarbonate transport system substrate-binding protein
MRTFISKSLKLVVPLLMGAVFTVIATAPVMAAELQTVRLQAVSGSVGGIPLMIMANEGLDKKHGFKGEFEFPPHEGASQNFLVGNSDIAMDNDIAGVAIARTEGFKITAFYPVGNHYTGIVVKKDSPLQDAQGPDRQESGPLRVRFRDHHVHSDRREQSVWLRRYQRVQDG